jgi:tRNA-dihydrouridine synthase
LFRSVCFVFNGSIRCKEEARAFLATERQLAGQDQTSFFFRGTLMARHAMWDPSVFADHRLSQGHLFVEEGCTSDSVCAVFRRMLAAYRWYHGNPSHVKYHLTRSFQEFPSTKPHLHGKLQMARTYGEFALILGYDPEIAQTCFGDVTFEELLMPLDGEPPIVSRATEDEQPHRKHARLE